MIRAYVTDNHAGIGLSLSIISQPDGSEPQILRLGTGWASTWEPIRPDDPDVKPTLFLGHYEARAALDALLAHYEGASDMRTTRADLVHARSRLDVVTDSVIDLAAKLAERRTSPAPLRPR